MRALLVASLVFVAALAGCSGKKAVADDDLHYTCPDGTEIHSDDYEGVLENITVDFLKTKCPKGSSGTGSKTNSTSLAPNQLPILKLKVTDTAGNETNVTMLMGNLTFDASGSSDPDGHVSAIAISVQDSNTTRTKPLYDLATKSFKPATFKFDRPGIVNVTIAMVDDRAGFNNTVMKAYVNHEQVVVGGTIQAPAQQNSAATHSCTGAQGVLENSASIVDAAYFQHKGFVVVYGATFVEAFPGTNSLVTICAPDGTPISAEKSKASPTVSTNTEPLPTPPATDSYEIGFYASAASTNAQARVIVHYEPRPAAAA